MTLAAVLLPAGEGGFIAFNPGTGSTTQGGAVPEAVNTPHKAAELYLEEFPPKQPGQAVPATCEVATYA